MQERIKKGYYLIMQEAGNESKVDSAWWIKYYHLNSGRFWAVLRQRVRLMRYTLEYESEMDDLMQSAVEKVLIQFQVKKFIPFQYRHTIFSLCCQNAVNQHVRQLNLFKGLPAMGMPVRKEGEKIDTRFSGDGERVMTTSMDYLSIDLKIDVSLALTKEENKIVVLLLQKYSRKEVARMLKINDRTVYKKLAKIKKKLEAAGLKECAC